jgi:uncharacterized protein YciI
VIGAGTFGAAPSLAAQTVLPPSISEGESMRDAAPKIPEMPVVPFFLGLLVPGSNHEVGPESFADHIEFIGTMTAANVILLGGGFETPVEGAEAAYLLRVASQAEAEAWVSKDPWVQNDVFRPRIIAWNLVGIALGAIDPALTGG